MPQTAERGRIPAPGEILRNGRSAMALVWNANARLTLAIGLLTLVVALLPTLATYLSKLIVDGVLAAIASGTTDDRNAALVWVAVEAGVMTALLGGRRVLRLQKTMLHAELGYAVSRRIFDKALSLELGQHEDPRIQQQMLLARQHATSRPFSMVNRLFEFVQYSITLVAFGVLLSTFSSWAVGLVVLGGLPLFFGELGFSGRVFRFYQGRTPEMRERSYLESLMTGESTAAERLHYDSGPQVMGRYERLFTWLYGEDRRLQSRRAYAGIALSALSSAVFFGTKAWIVWVTISGAITLGAMTMFVGVVKQGQGAVTSLLSSLGGIYEDLLYLSNLSDYLAIEVPRGSGAVREGAKPGDGIRLERVTFRYPGSTRPALRDVSLHIPPGQHVGLMGANGSGKTTLVKLLTGLYRADAGAVTLDGTDVHDWEPDALRARMGVLFQPFVRYKMTARDNIAMGRGLREGNDKDLLAAAEAGVASDVLDELPEGLDTRLSRRFLDGRELSGGQWQRLALARAMLRDRADILILDEPTAAMDAAAEAEFIRTAEAREFDRTVVLISHRLANLRHADQILVLDAGRLVESGTHASLIESGGLYAELFEAQAAPYSSSSPLPA
jgi:ABC-type multidrug transport system fused ATPase/permease subunit